MTTSRQRAANRRNAALSTGPNTEAGKAAASFNALSHGLYARRVVLPGEDRGAYERLRADLRRDLAPVGRVEEGLAARAADIWWRLERAGAIEAGLLNPHWHADGGADPAALIHAFRHALDETDTLDVLGRHEGRLERALARTLTLLARLQGQRRRRAGHRPEGTGPGDGPFGAE